MEQDGKRLVEDTALCTPQKLAAVSPRWVAVAGVQFCIIFALVAMLAISAQGLHFWKNESIQAREQLGDLEANLREKADQIKNLQLHLVASHHRSDKVQQQESPLLSMSQYDLLTALHDADYARYQQAAEPVLVYQSMASAFGK